ncbi:MAG: asparagine synthase (glutamine-hydrolyzing) [Alphaproteobacteria bacterium]
MCGLAGVIDFTRSVGEEPLRAVTTAMADSLVHRGPDDGGVWVDAAAGIGLGHRRLSIVDLSPAGHQPMVSADGRYVIVYNGEVYSHQVLRTELEALGRRFRGHSDTEVILEACAEWGVPATVRRLIGMFAIALWDRKTRTLTLVRDRLGIKPLYWGRFGSLFLFGSELKALRAHPGWRPEINRDAVVSFLRHNYVPAPHSIYLGVHKLEPGRILTLDADGVQTDETFWDARAVALAGLADPLQASDEEMTGQLDALLRDAVGRRMVADVPLGAFLSGGVDSSTVVAMMQAQSDRRIKTFSIGFDEAGFDEAPHARAVAEHLGTDHTELYVRWDDALALVPKLSEWYDEPFADSSQIPTFLVSEMTRRHVTVALSGDGGDELFAGYNRYFLASTLWRQMNRLPRPLRKLASAGLRLPSQEAWDRLFRLVPAAFRLPQAGDKLHKLAAVLEKDDADAIYRRLVTHWDGDDETVAVGGIEPRGILWDEALKTRIPGFVDRMQFLDTVTYLPDDILTKVDRASMAVALEARVPLIDHRVVEFSWRLPASAKIRGGQGKWLLRRVLDRYVPRSLIERPKMGFGVPVAAWLRALN